MPKRPDFLPVKTKAGWMVSVPPGMTADGKRVRKFFADEKAAKKYAGTMRASHSSGVRGALIDAATGMQAAEAMRILEPLGISLVEAARMAVAQAAQTGGAAEMRETFGERWLRTMMAGEMVWSAVYARDMGNIPKWVGPAVMETPCGLLNRQVLKAAVEEHRSRNAGTVKMSMLRVMAVLSGKERQEAKRAEVTILTVGQAARLLRVCERREERWVVAILLFAGVRPDVEYGEIGRLEWEAFSAGEIYLSGEVSKTPQDRRIPICPRLRRLLRGHPKTGRVIPNGWKKAWQRIRRDAGISHLADVCRHTFASNYLGAHGEAEAKQALGHTAGSATLFRFYRRAVTSAAGRKFLGEVALNDEGKKAGATVP